MKHSQTQTSPEDITAPVVNASSLGEEASDETEQLGRARAVPLRHDLSQSFIKLLRADQQPTGYGPDGKIRFETVAEKLRKSFIIWDSHHAAPDGFGLKVAKRKTFIVRRKLEGISHTVKVGDAKDFQSVDDARDRARELLQVLHETGRNPNQVRRERWEAELTLEQALERYGLHLKDRTQRPAGPETLRVHDRVVQRMEALKWSKRPINELSGSEIKTRFKELKHEHISAHEQAFRWVDRAVTWCIEAAKFEPLRLGQSPVLVVNPFDILRHERLYRSNSQVERDREERGVRNPLNTGQDLGRFLEAAWSKRATNDNATGVDFLLLMLLWGCRKSEHAGLVWDEFLDDKGEPGSGRRTTSHVCLDPKVDMAPYVYFHTTKNGHSHRLPIPPLTLKLLEMRQTSAAEETLRRGFSAKSRRFVFPSRSPLSRSGHYSDAGALLKALRDEIEVARLTPHDLRRSFGGLMTALNISEKVMKRFLNHRGSSVTDRYTTAEWKQLREEMTKIEEAMFLKAPNVFNDLKPAGWNPLPAPERHKCRPPAPRTGRPPKDSVQVD